MPSFAILGLGRFGRMLAVTLARSGAEVIACDRSEQAVNIIKDDVAVAAVLDTTDPEALKAQGIDKVDAAVVCIGESFEANLLTTVHLQAMGVPRIITRYNEDVQRVILQRLGVSDVLSPEDDAALHLAQRLMAPEVMDYLELGDDHGLVKVVAPAHFVGRSLTELALRQKYAVNLVAIKRKNGKAENVFVPGADERIKADDILMAAGLHDDLEKLARA